MHRKKIDVTKPLSPAVGNGENCLSKVRLNVSVWSRNKGFLNDLTDDSFEVYEGKEKRQIECFAKTDEPVSVGILIDVSGSANLVKMKYHFLVEGLVSFIARSNPENEYFIIGFAVDSSVLLEPTQDRKKIEKALKTILTLKPAGNTGLYDALDFGFEKISSGKFNKKALLVLLTKNQTNRRITILEI